MRWFVRYTLKQPPSSCCLIYLPQCLTNSVLHLCFHTGISCFPSPSTNWKVFLLATAKRKNIKFRKGVTSNLNCWQILLHTAGKQRHRCPPECLFLVKMKILIQSGEMQIIKVRWTRVPHFTTFNMFPTCSPLHLSDNAKHMGTFLNTYSSANFIEQ